MKDGGTTAAYTYSPDGLRVSKTVNGETTTHILDGANVVADIQGTSISKYNRGRGLISIEQDGNKGYYVFNGHGDITSIVDSSGTNSKGYYFSAYGENMLETGSGQFANPFGYAGEYTDEETGNIYLRARYYDPNTGRFLSEDPIKDGTNWYSYAGNNPVLYIDPWGLADIFLTGDRQYWVTTFDEMQEITDDTLDYNRETGEVFIVEMGSGKKKTGTALIRDLLNEEDDFTVYIERNAVDENGNLLSTGEVSHRPRFARYNINDKELSDLKQHIMLENENGKTYLQSYAETPSFLFLAHELIHAQHRKNGTFNGLYGGTNYYTYNGVHTEIAEFFYNEEYETVGIQYFTSTPNPNSKSINPYCQISTYQPITENTIRQEQGLDSRIAYSTFDKNGNALGMP